MNKKYGITAENLMRTLPDYLRRDPNVVAVAQSFATQLARYPDELEYIRIYSRIDELPEELLDILAYDFKVDWWDPNYTVDEKRQVLKDSWAVRRTLGTKAAVEKAISAIYSDTYVSEWFQYGGQPYHFTLHIDSTFEDYDPVQHQRVLDRLEYYKNLRSKYTVEYTARPFGHCKAHTTVGAVALSGEMTVNIAGAPALEV